MFKPKAFAAAGATSVLICFCCSGFKKSKLEPNLSLAICSRKLSRNSLASNIDSEAVCKAVAVK